ncbi:MAG: 50S ribosomal protein L15 [Streptococcaceae bacterium]|jgi:large subunit ribosomal protein L15|nr:50S ribosomal protein L15 [Streptococcaceae bacterium]
MELNNLHPAEGSRKTRNRVGRGTSSGNGKTSGRGQKGQKARSGGKVRPGFEGGQTPLFRRMPKRGFLNVNRKEYAIVNLDQLNKLKDGSEVTVESLVEAKIVKQTLDGVKILGNGDLKAKNLKVKVAKISETAKAAIEKAGGSVELVEVKKFEKAAK